MKESISNAYILNIILVFVGVIIVLLVGSLSYSKAFKAKTKLISIVEKHKGYDNDTKTEIEEYLKSVGYKVARSSSAGVCPKVNGAEAINTDKSYDYCIYSFDTVKGNYYRVTVFISFEIPVISSYLRIPMSGETRVIFEL